MHLLKPLFFPLLFGFDLSIRSAITRQHGLHIEDLLVCVVAPEEILESKPHNLPVRRKPKPCPANEKHPREIDTRLHAENNIILVDYSFFESSSVESVTMPCIWLAIAPKPTVLISRPTCFSVRGLISVP